MKFWRGLYIAAIYIAVAPIALVFSLGTFLVCLIGMKKDTGKFYIGDLIEGWWSGVKEGHDMLMFWVRYGEIDLYSFNKMMKVKGSK